MTFDCGTQGTFVWTPNGSSAAKITETARMEGVSDNVYLRGIQDLFRPSVVLLATVLNSSAIAGVPSLTGQAAIELQGALDRIIREHQARIRGHMS